MIPNSVCQVSRLEVVEVYIEVANVSLACVFTSSTSRALRVAKNIETGMVNINMSQGMGLEAPFGGSKQSGIGREGGRGGIMHYLEPKTIAIK